MVAHAILGFGEMFLKTDYPTSQLFTEIPYQTVMVGFLLFTDKIMNALLNYRSRVVKVLIALTGCISLVFVSQGCARIHPVTLNATVSAAHIRIFRSTVTPSSTSVSSSIPAKTPLPQTKIPTATHTFTLTPTTSIIEIVIPTCSGGGHPLPPTQGFWL